MSGKLKKIITGSLEVVKDSARQITETVSPGALLEQALGKQSSPKKDELGSYLENLSSLTEEELKQKQAELSEEDRKKIEETRKKLFPAMPAHLRPRPKPPPPRPYEATIQEEEQKKAQALEAQKKQASSVISPPAGKQPRGMLFGGLLKRKKSVGFEGIVKDTKA